MHGFRKFTPHYYVDDWRAAYGLECIRIWRECIEYRERTGKELDAYYPTEDEFRAARRAFSRRSLWAGGATSP